MLLRVGIMLLVTGAALLSMGWFDPFGPLVMIFGSCCGAIALESLLDVEPWNGESTPRGRGRRDRRGHPRGHTSGRLISG